MVRSSTAPADQLRRASAVLDCEAMHASLGGVQPFTLYPVRMVDHACVDLYVAISVQKYIACKCAALLHGSGATALHIHGI